MDTYATCIGADGTPDEYIAIARFYETKSVSKAQPRQTVRQMISHLTRYIPPRLRYIYDCHALLHRKMPRQVISTARRTTSHAPCASSCSVATQR